MEYDAIVAGAGIWGCTVARRLAEAGRKVLVLERVDQPDVQGTTVVNYVDADVTFTRQHEYKHFHPEWPKSGQTIICREYSSSWQIGDEPYYPIANPESAALLKMYQDEAGKVTNLTVGGRLGGYKYYDMDKAMAAALELPI